jgi:hypothetical protein
MKRDLRIFVRTGRRVTANTASYMKTTIVTTPFTLNTSSPDNTGAALTLKISHGLAITAISTKDQI